MSGAIPIARLAVHLIAGFGVSKVVKDIVLNNTTVRTPVDAARVWTGSLVIGSMITEVASKYVNTHIDGVIAWNEKRKAAETTPE